ncbi:MAG: protein translocase subunit SecF [Patescibacteria group bacterium]|nr:protein translocase subunit SecF [Patescibacteria group bacterium]MCL5431482.1 protein translocase subunit SecF [Patescibacteria group bacterium]
MFNLMKFKYVFFGISLLVILPGLFSLARWGLRPSIDFTGGTVVEKNAAGQIIRSDTVGPVIGRETTINAVESVGVASLAIILYIAYAFREIPKPYSPWKFGIAAVVALLHDVLVVVGIFSLLGHFANVQIDSLFITALLTVIGFSVHDTIVVFDRIRENLRKSSAPFTQVVNESVLQTLGRSLMTSITVLLTLLALILFGGESIHWFVVALFIGVFSGTYSSIFNAAPLLVLWEEKKK